MAQMKAFDLRDLEACLNYWADDLTITILPQAVLVLSGKEQAREFLQQQFNHRANSTKILDPRTDGCYVHLLHQEVLPNGQIRQTKFSYLIKNNLISQLWAEPLNYQITHPSPQQPA